MVCDYHITSREADPCPTSLPVAARRPVGRRGCPFIRGDGALHRRRSSCRHRTGACRGGLCGLGSTDGGWGRVVRRGGPMLRCRDRFTRRPGYVEVVGLRFASRVPVHRDPPGGHGDGRFGQLRERERPFAATVRSRVAPSAQRRPALVDHTSRLPLRDAALAASWWPMVRLRIRSAGARSVLFECDVTCEP